MIPIDMAFGEIHKTNSFGDVLIIKYLTSFNVEIEFINTSSRTVTTAAMIRKGSVRDKFSPAVCGFGYVGVGNYKPRVNGRDSNAYIVWHDMIVRCYSQNKLLKSPTYKGCTVCDEWRNFQSFAKWFSVNYIKGYQIDKDMIVSGNKVYSPATCLFISRAENMAIARARYYVVKSPAGEIVEVFNMRKFCIKNNLNPSYMASVCKGNKKSYKGWTRSGKT